MAVMIPDRTADLQRILQGNYRLRADARTLESVHQKFEFVYELDGNYYALGIGPNNLIDLQTMGIETRKVYPSNATDVRYIRKLMETKSE